MQKLCFIPKRITVFEQIGLVNDLMTQSKDSQLFSS